MKDIFNREIKDGDFVIVKPTGRDSHGLHLGVIVGERVMLRLRNCTPYIATYNQYYLVENPTQLEIDYINKMKQDYQDHLDKKSKQKALKEAILIVKKKDIVVGKCYDRGMYVGRVEIKEDFRSIKAGIYENCFVGFDVSSDEIHLLRFGKIYGCRDYSVVQSTKTFPKVYERDNRYGTATLDEIVSKLKEERKRRKADRYSWYRHEPYIPNMVLLDVGIEI